MVYHHTLSFIHTLVYDIPFFNISSLVCCVTYLPSCLLSSLNFIMLQVTCQQPCFNTLQSFLHISDHTGHVVQSPPRIHSVLLYLSVFMSQVVCHMSSFIC